MGLPYVHNRDEHENIAGRRLLDGTFYTRLTVCYPPALASALAAIIHDYVSKTATTVPITSWREFKTVKFLPQQLFSRVEDGGGLISTAVWHSPEAPDVFS